MNSPRDMNTSCDMSSPRNMSTLRNMNTPSNMNTPRDMNSSFADFLCLLLPLEVFGDDDSKISLLFSYWQLLVGHGVVAIYIVVSNVHHCAFVNIKFNLPLVGPMFQVAYVFLKLYYVLWESCFAAEFCVISEF